MEADITACSSIATEAGPARQRLIFAWGDAVSCFEFSPEVSEIGESPSVCYLAHGAMSLIGILKRVSAPRQTPGERELFYRRVLRRQKFIRIANADAYRVSHVLYVQFRVGEPRLYRRTNASKQNRL